MTGSFIGPRKRDKHAFLFIVHCASHVGNVRVCNRPGGMVSRIEYTGRNWTEADNALIVADRDRVGIMADTYLQRYQESSADDEGSILVMHKRTCIIQYFEYGVTRVFPGVNHTEAVRTRLNLWTLGAFAWHSHKLRLLFQLQRLGGGVVGRTFVMPSGRTMPCDIWDGMNVGSATDD